MTMSRRTVLGNGAAWAAMGVAGPAWADFQPSPRYPDPAVRALDPSFEKTIVFFAAVEQIATGGTRYTAQDGADPGAPQKVHVLRVDFRAFGGTVGTDFGPSLNGTEKLTDLAAAAGAVAGINAQWFYNSAPGGMYVKDGKLIGSATQGRGGIKITRGGRSVDVDAYTARVTLRAGRTSAEIDGVNRVPGEIWNCGGVGAHKPGPTGGT